MTEDTKALQPALADITAENLRLRSRHASLQGDIQALQALLLQSNHRLASTTSTLVAAGRTSARAAAQALVEAQSSALPAMIEAARKSDEAAIVTLGSVVELQNCVNWATEVMRATLTAQSSRVGGAA